MAKKRIRLESGMMDQIMLVSGTGPVETWDVLGVWHISQRDKAEERLAEVKQLGHDLDDAMMQK
jgi:hypothetical protein